MKIIRRAFLSVLILLFAISPVNFAGLFYALASPDSWYNPDQYLFINEDTVWESGTVITLNKNLAIDDGAKLTIEPGVKIIFDTLEDDWETACLYVSNGSIIAEGSAENPIIFDVAYPEWQRTQFYFFAEPQNDPSFFRYVEFRNGGIEFPDGELSQNNFLQKAFASNQGSGSFAYQSGKVTIENSRFQNSLFSDVEINFEISEDNPDDFLKIINSNFESDTKNAIWLENFECRFEDEDLCQINNFFDFKNNWYADSEGPNFSKNVPEEIQIDTFRQTSLIADPAIIIPGILGSWEINEEWQLDPILQTYSNLTFSLQENGFEKNINLFEFPFEWRNSNVLTAELLKEKIADIKSSTGVSRVDLVAHSMGGLVSREYIEGKNYQEDIDQLITLGTPHHGSPEAYLKWEAGEGFKDKFEKLGKLYFQLEALHAGYTDLKEYLQERIVSVKELLPDYDYLFDIKKSKLKKYPDDYPRNTFLENLNEKDNLEKLKSVNFTNIIGKVTKENTIQKFRVTESSKDDKWEHGMPENFYDTSTDQGIEYGEGDETVPLESAQDIEANKNIEVKSAHGDLPTLAQCEVFETLSGNGDCEYFDTFDRVTNFLTFGVFSPVDIQIISPSGKKIGTDFESGDTINEIDGAFYSGNTTENEFITIPNPEDGEYQIIAKGTGNGEYTIEVNQIKEFDGESQSRIISTQTGNAALNAQESLSFSFEDSDEVSNFENVSEVYTIVTNSTTSTDDEDNEEDDDDKDEEDDNEIVVSVEENTPSQNILLAGFSNNSKKDSTNITPHNSEKSEDSNSEVKGVQKKNYLFFILITLISISLFSTLLFFVKRYKLKNN